MLTKNQKSNAWKYALSLPLFALCFMMMSAKQNENQRIRKGNITTFRGNTIKWKTSSDTILVTSPTSSEVLKEVTKSDVIIQCNGQSVLNGYNSLSAGFKSEELKYISNNISEAIYNKKSTLLNSFASLDISHLVLDKNYHPVYYDVQTTDTNYINKVNAYPKINELVDKVLMNNNVVNPSHWVSNQPYYVIDVPIIFEYRNDKINLRIK